MIHEYFLNAKQELENLFNEVYDSVDRFKFENIILHEEENKVTQMLIKGRFSLTVRTVQRSHVCSGRHDSSQTHQVC